MSHFRSSTLSVDQTGLFNFTFTGQQSWRASFYGSPVVGQLIAVTTLFFGDGTNTTLYLRVLAVNSGEDYFVGEIVNSAGSPIQHTYASAGAFEAYFESSARITTNDAWSNASYRGEVTVNPGTLNEAPVSSVPAIVQVADNAIFTYQIPAFDPDNNPLSFRIGTANEFIYDGAGTAFVAPAGVTISSSGLLTWDVRDVGGATVTPGQLYTMTAMISDGLASTPVDFLLQIVSVSTNQAPSFVLVPPTQNLTIGQTVNLALTATDPNANLSNIQVLNPPAGMITDFHLAHSELHIDFTAGTSGTFVVTFQAVDAGGLTAQTSITFNVAANSPPVITTAPGDNAGTVVEAGNLDNGTVAPGTPSVSKTLTASDSDAGATQAWTGNANGTYGTFAITSAGTWTYTLDNTRAATHGLNEGSSVTETFTATVTDDKGATANQSVTVTITGTNDAPVVTTAAGNNAGAVTEAGNLDNGTVVPGSPSVSKTLTASDVDTGATMAWSGNANGTYGTFAINAAGTWTYTLDNARTATQGLNEGQTVTETFTATVTDDKGAFATQTVTVTVNGTNDSPVVSGGPVSAAYMRGPLNPWQTYDGDAIADSMNDVFGPGNWTQIGAYSVANLAQYSFLYIDFSDGNSGAFRSFIANASNRTALENWVAAGGDLFLNGARNDTTDPVELFLGVTWNRDPTFNGSAANASHPIIDNDGLNGDDTGLSWTGGYFTHDYLTGGSLTPIVLDGSGRVSLGAKSFGAGTVVFGGLTTDFFDETNSWGPGNSTSNLLDNIITYAAGGIGSSITSGTVVEAGNLDNGTVVPGTPSAVGTLSATDVDAGDVLTWSGSLDGTYGNFAITAGGAWTYTLGNARAATQALAEGASVTETFTATVTDSFGAIATQTVTITITGTNDSPVVTTAVGGNAGTVVEAGNLDNGTVVPGTTSVSNTLTASDVDTGATQTWSGNANGTYGTFAITTGGVWTYTLVNSRAATQALAEGQTGTETFTATVTDDKGATATQTVTVSVTGTNDSPVVTTAAGNNAGAVTEAGNLDSGAVTPGTPSVSKSLAATDVDAGAVLTWSGNANGTYGTFSIAGGGGWTYALDNSRAATQALKEGQIATETFLATVTDDKGATATQSVTVTVNGTNDAPVINPLLGISANQVEDGYNANGQFDHVPPSVGQMAASDVDSGAVLTWSIVGGGDTPNGSVVVTQSGRWTYYLDNGPINGLALGESTADTFTVRVTDENGASDDQQVVIDIAGRNDLPMIDANAPANVPVFELPDGFPGENTSARTASGQIAFSDVDLSNTHTATVQALGGAYLGTFTLGAVDNALNRAAWDFSVADAALDGLAGGETLTQTYRITLTDSSGGTDTHDLSILLVGTNDAAILSSANVVVLQGASPATASGDLTIDDVDGPELFQVQNGTAGTYGSFSIDADGQWSFQAFAANPNLAPGQSLTDVFQVLAADGTPTSVIVTIAGSNDASSARPDSFETDEATAIGAGLSLFANNGFGADSDPDNPLVITTVNGQSLVGSQITLASGALLTVNADGTFAYDPNDSFNTLNRIAGTANQFEFDGFSYGLADGSGTFVLIQVRGVNSPEDVLLGQSLSNGQINNTIVGTAGRDTFMLQPGGTDNAYGLEGNDGFYFGGVLDSHYVVDGGPGADTLAIQGNYPDLQLGTGIVGVEVLLALSGSDTRFGDSAGNLYDYDITSADANVAAGGILTVQAAGLLPGEDLTFDGSNEADGAFRVFAGRGVDNLTGGNGNDGFFFGNDGNFTGADRVNGGPGADSLALRGNYAGAGAVVFQDATITNVEAVVMLSGHTNEYGGLIVANGFDYDLTLANGNVAAAQMLSVVAFTLHADESVRFDARAELDGSVRILSGAGADTLFGSAGADFIHGGFGADTIDGGGGTDLYVYRSALESTEAARDTLVFGAGDRIDLSAIDADAGTAANDAFAFIGNGAFGGVAGQLRATLQAGQWIIEGDVNGDGVADLVIAVTSVAPIVAADFIL